MKPVSQSQSHWPFPLPTTLAYPHPSPISLETRPTGLCLLMVPHISVWFPNNGTCLCVDSQFLLNTLILSHCVDLSAVGGKKKREKEEKEEGRKDEKGMCEGKIENEFRG